MSELDGPTLYSSLIAEARFHILARSIYQRITSRLPFAAMEALHLQSVIDDHYAHAPSYLRGNSLASEPEWLMQARNRLLWGYKHLQLLLYRPFLHVRTSCNGNLPMLQPNSEAPLVAVCRARYIINSTDIINSIYDNTKSRSYNRLDIWDLMYVYLLPFGEQMYMQQLDEANNLSDTVNSRFRHSQIRHIFSLGTKICGRTHFFSFSHI